MWTDTDVGSPGGNCTADERQCQHLKAVAVVCWPAGRTKSHLAPLLLSPPGATRNSAHSPGESCSCKCRHPLAAEQICFIPLFQEPANILCTTIRLSFDLFSLLGPKLIPVQGRALNHPACAWQPWWSLALLAEETELAMQREERRGEGRKVVTA